MARSYRFAIISAILLALCIPVNLLAGGNPPSVSMTFRVELRPDIWCNIHAIHLLNLNHPSGGKTLLAIPGMGLTAGSYRGLVEELFAVENHSRSHVFSRAILVDYPGHGASGLPESGPTADPLLFGDLQLEDYLATVRGVLSQLNLMEMTPDVLVGHCLGGMIIQMAQQELIREGSNLRRKYGIKEAVLIAPDPPGQVGGSRLTPGSIDLSPFVAWSPDLGMYLDLPAPFILNFFFTNFYGELVPGAPLEYLTDPSLIADESLTLLKQILGLPPFSAHPMTDSGIFRPDHGVSLRVVAFSHDFFYTPEGQLNTYTYLSGDRLGRRFYFIDTRYAVHGMYYSDPAALIEIGKVF
jgi:pimeloyl-ACP methyl ester carboxylesterase